VSALPTTVWMRFSASPAAIMARRLFDAAQRGERDHEKLKEAALEAKVIQLRAYGCVAAPDRKSV